MILKRIIQETIKKEFSECTTLTIAHRLNTVVDSDLILILSQGSVIEFNSPYELMVQTPPTEFYRMVEEMGQPSVDYFCTHLENKERMA